VIKRPKNNNFDVTIHNARATKQTNKQTNKQNKHFPLVMEIAVVYYTNGIAAFAHISTK
jgi:hypothetical protein